MRNKIKHTLLLCVLTALLLTVPTLADTIGGGTVAADALNLRTAANTSSASQILIPQGSFLLVEEEFDGWYKVSWNGREGYVSAEFVDYAAQLDGACTAAATVKGTNVRMRAEANTTSGILGIYDTGAVMAVLGVDGQWLHVCDTNGVTGYIRSDLLSYGETVAATDDLGQQIVATAKQYLGTDYVWGGMSEAGFDCSGFVNYIYKLYGYSMYRVAQDMYTNNGTAVSKDQLQPGDMVFFGYSAWNITHVGMYIGNGQFIHASSSANEVVITDLSQSYYTRMYVGAKRVIA